jgi:methyl coenzyme M reductase alpha subunit
MKKLMTALTICAVAGFATAADVVSENIVGFLSITASGTYPSHGPTFITVGDVNVESTLGNLTANGMDPDSDTIQFLSPVDASVVDAATYCDAALATLLGDPGLQGWWAPSDVGGVNKDDMVLTAGTGFLCNFGSGNPIVIKSAGEVVQAPISLDMTGLVYPMVANPVPADLTLGDITADGMDPDSDTIQFLDPTDASVVDAATYCDAALATLLGDPGLQGWWAPSDVGGVDKNSTAFPAGSAVLCNFGSGNPITVVFPNPVP